MSFLHRPRKIWWRKAMFQAHLWVGIILCLYMLVIGVTGSILVFEEELEHTAYPNLWHASAEHKNNASVDFPTVIHTVMEDYPGYQITAAYPPDRPGDNFEVFIYRNEKILYVFVDAYTGQKVGAIDPKHSWLVWIIDLHFRLLGGKTGEMLNGIGAISLLVLCITGIVVWWGGLKRWWHGVMVNFRRNWKRVNYDLHSAIGFWTLLILSMWAVSGIYFVWPKPIESFVNHFSSIASANPPKFELPRHEISSQADLGAMIEQAKQISPHAQFGGAFFPGKRNGALTLLMARGPQRRFTQMDYIYFDPVTGRQLAIWHRGITHTWGSTFLFWLSPLHFGYDFGMAIKILWAILGCSLPLLSISGTLMYWNRSLSKKWKKLASPGGASS
jgi:uncharacterized iron-regulated membrane protein